MERQFGAPVTFGDCAGFLHDGGGSTGVIMLPAWGFEEMTIRRGWAGFADRLARAGYCTLRFDWPGCADSLGALDEGMRLAAWHQSILDAVAYVRRQAGIETIVLVGHGVGGLMAMHAAGSVPASAVVAMAPQSEGNAGLREMEIWGRMIGSFLRLPAPESKDRLEVAGHAMSRSFAAEIAALKLPLDPPLKSAVPLLLVQRGGGGVSPALLENLKNSGFDATSIAYSGWDAFLSQTEPSVAPTEDFAAVVDWLAARAAPSKRLGGGLSTGEARPLEGPDFVERPILFGGDRGLFGVLCEPRERRSKAVVVMINSGDNYHIGWARMHVQFARILASSGISSFRIDTGGIGEAADVEGHLFYVQRQTEDVLAAVSSVHGRQLGPVILMGRCSGGYAAVQAAVADERIRGIVAINTIRLSIGEHETFEEVMSAGTSSVADYGKRALSPRLLLDILSGRMPITTIWNKGRQILRTQFSLRFPKLYTRLSPAGRLTKVIRSQAASLQDRQVAVQLIYADNDGGIDELARHFGRKNPEEYDHATVRIIAGAEHNMTAPFARQAILAAAIETADQVAGRAA